MLNSSAAIRSVLIATIALFSWLGEAQAESIGNVETFVAQPDEVSPQQDQHLSFNFGRVWVNTRQSVAYKLKNNGKTPLTVQKVTISGSFFDADTECQGILEVGKSCLTRVYYWPAFEGLHTGRLVWYTSENNVILDLWGEGIR